ncbi:MAG: DUF934 domain-containing protein [Gammaproteobacteria bacterium]|nr:DUF934 domain-containing protein [Gammaproteobacteria bacterium]
MEIIRQRKVERDDWQRLPDDHDVGAGGIPARGRLIVPLQVLLDHPGLVTGRRAPTGVLLGPADEVEALASYLDDIALVAIEFPTFTEGRGYSQARLLRERDRFRGEIRALGDVSRDRLAFMERCGFDTFALRPGETPEQALAAFTEIVPRYQPAADPGDTVKARRAATVA